MPWPVASALAIALVSMWGARMPAASCAKTHACPASDHQYVWRGLVCATPSSSLRSVDTTAVMWHGAAFRCHSARVYPWHTGIVATTFWVGEIFAANLADGSQVCSTYDSQWAYHWSGVDRGRVPADAADCAGSIVGGCDGVPGPGASCRTESRTAANGFFPTRVAALENPFYLDLPFDDVNDPVAFRERCSVIPWAYQRGFAGHCRDAGFSYMKNHWVRIVGPNGKSCYGQIEDAGPAHGSLYHDAVYVFGTTNARPVQGRFNDAGMDVSPALNGCLGFKELDGDSDRVSWRFVDPARVPAGPWRRIVTARPLFNH